MSIFSVADENAQITEMVKASLSRVQKKMTSRQEEMLKKWFLRRSWDLPPPKSAADMAGMVLTLMYQAEPEMWAPRRKKSTMFMMLIEALHNLTEGKYPLVWDPEEPWPLVTKDLMEAMRTLETLATVVEEWEKTARVVLEDLRGPCPPVARDPLAREWVEQAKKREEEQASSRRASSEKDS